jgi:ABC-type branched-subunit amino acid transport system permease subunit
VFGLIVILVMLLLPNGVVGLLAWIGRNRQIQA